MKQRDDIVFVFFHSRFREGFISVFCWCSCQPCKKVRTQLRFRRTLYPTGVTNMSEKYSERNGSLMHTMTEYVDVDVNGTRMIARNSCALSRKAEDYV